MESKVKDLHFIGKESNKQKYNLQAQCSRICSVNGFRASLIFRPFFVPALASSCDWQERFYIHKAPINSTIF